MRAILSVYDKTGVVDFARGLEALGFEIFSTGGTEGLLRWVIAWGAVGPSAHCFVGASTAKHVDNPGN